MCFACLLGALVVVFCFRMWSWDVMRILCLCHKYAHVADIHNECARTLFEMSVRNVLFASYWVVWKRQKQKYAQGLETAHVFCRFCHLAFNNNHEKQMASVSTLYTSLTFAKLVHHSIPDSSIGTLAQVSYHLEHLSAVRGRGNCAQTTAKFSWRYYCRWPND